jgi:hypothetical protein
MSAHYEADPWGRSTPSGKAARFFEALQQLCYAHHVRLVAPGYEYLDVFDLHAGEEPLAHCGFQDRTEPLTLEELGT